MKDIALSTMEKLERRAKERNLEGNSTKSNSFGVLPIEEIIDITAGMGVIIENDDFMSFDLLKDLERARGDPYQKQNTKNLTSQTETVEKSQIEPTIYQLEWLHEESSE